MNFAGKSDVGRKRTTNQDNFIVKKLCPNTLFLSVCDGMGGANGGNIASGIAIEVLSDCVNECVTTGINAETGMFIPQDKTCDFMFKTAYSTANTAVYNISQTTPVLHGMGTTAVCALLVDNRIYAANVGDSRLYCSRDDGIEQISKDHSYVQYLMDIGEITKEEAEASSQKNIITRAIGIDSKVTVDTFAIDTCPGTKLLLCTDGLSNNLSDEELQTILRDESSDTNGKLNKLIDLANERGGSDNITAVIAEL